MLPTLLLACTLLTACDEVKEVDAYDNWKERNEAFADSLNILASNRVVASLEAADAMEVGKYYMIETAASTTAGKQYIYVKKLTANTDGVRPYYTDGVAAFYYGTDINGERFDGNFLGYSATNQGALSGADNMPTQFDSPTEFYVSGVISGWTTALQYMRRGERWMVFIPYPSAYGVKDTSTIPGYSLLCFDIVLHRISGRD